MSEKRNSSLFYGFIAVVMALVAFFVSWKMILPEYSQNKAKYSKLEAEVSASREKLASLRTARRSLDNLGTLVDDLFVAIPKDKDTPNLISELEAIAAKHKTYLPNIQITEGVGASSNTLQISLSVKGPFEETQAFIKSLEDNLKFFNIKSVTLGSAADNQTSLALQIEAYKQVDTSLAASVAPEVLPGDEEVK